MREPSPEYGNVYTVEEVARRLRVDSTTVRRWAQNGALQEGVDFFVLPYFGKRRSVRFTEVQYQRILSKLVSQS